MTQITTIHNRVKTVLAATLSGYNRLPFAYLLDKNPIYDKSYGFLIGPAAKAREDNFISCRARILKRTVTIPIVNQAAYNLGDTDSIDAGILNLAEDFLLVYKALEDDGDLNNGVAAINTEYTDDSGIQFAEVSRATVAAIIVNFDITYRESLS